jgi:hypothetical protein
MSVETFDIEILFRRPIYPVFIFSADRIRMADNPPALAQACQRSTPHVAGRYVILLDNTMEEFWFCPEQRTLMPGFVNIHWPKKRLIDTYNQSVNAQQTGVQYPTRSINNRSVVRIFSEILALVQRSEGLTT